MAKGRCGAESWPTGGSVRFMPPVLTCPPAAQDHHRNGPRQQALRQRPVCRRPPGETGTVGDDPRRGGRVARPQLPRRRATAHRTGSAQLLATFTAWPSSPANSFLDRSVVTSGCGSSARPDLCGGRPAMGVPTATPRFGFRPVRRGRSTSTGPHLCCAGLRAGSRSWLWRPTSRACSSWTQVRGRRRGYASRA